ncbi:matrix remodeling-associated protein 8-like [Engraulis encrasicolus]|uniref:matrix remodeling-associated protein 8-like n=1 Tax=Engraulis encrasicolus TaxID=184585 RepID=UPI002FD44EFE
MSAGCLQSEEVIEITKLSGESVLLPCSCGGVTQAFPQDAVRWLKEQPPSHLEIYPNTHEDYAGRIKMSHEVSPGDFSLLISHLTKKDEGPYRCEILHHFYRDIRLRIAAAPVTTKPEVTTPETQAPVTKGKDDETKSPSYLFILGAVLLLLLLLGGAAFLYLRHKRLRGKTPHSTRIHSDRQNKSEDTETDNRDDVTYTTVVHGANPNVAQVRMSIDDRTEYASIRTT